jgi:hypothetical protein
MSETIEAIPGDAIISTATGRILLNVQGKLKLLKTGEKPGSFKIHVSTSAAFPQGYSSSRHEVGETALVCIHTIDSPGTEIKITVDGNQLFAEPITIAQNASVSFMAEKYFIVEGKGTGFIATGQQLQIV